MTRKEKILLFIQSKSYMPLKFEELASVLDVPSSDLEEFSRYLDELQREGKIYFTKKKRYAAIDEASDIVCGVLRCNAKGFFGFVLNDSGDVFVSGNKLLDAVNNDTVLVRLDNPENKDKRREGHIIKVVSRGNTSIVGVIRREKNGFYKMYPDGRQFYFSVRIAPEDMMSAKIGDRVSAEITEYGRDGKIHGRVTAVLGNEQSLKGCIEGIILENGIKQEFDESTLKEAEKIPNEITDIGGRADFRDMTIFTIDGDDARDFDDAVSLSRLDNGNYSLGVHIADVTHYVRENSALDNEAFMRGTSVYLADRVIPMLPEKLSNGICSLNPNVDRFTLSVIMEVNPEGQVVSHELKKAVIRSKERMTYNNVNKILSGDEELNEQYSHIVPTLHLMENLAEILRKKRDKRGAIQFDFPESGIRVDEDGNPIEIIKIVRGKSEKIIEEFMLLANETVAEYAFWSELPFVYRVHEAPSVEKLTEFNTFLQNFNLSIRERIDGDSPIHPKSLQSILDSVKDSPEERMVATRMLRSLMKADYRTENLGHFGLAAKYYCHFTSPIRRYPDLIIHRALKLFLDGKEIHCNMSKAAVQSSDREVAAENAERDTDDLMKTAYISQFVGETFNGVVSSVANFGIFIELENSVEGLIRFENMEGDYFEFDENSNSIIGKRTGQIYRVGDEVSVVLAKADIISRQIDFVLEKDAKASMLKKFEKTKKKVTAKKQISKNYRKRVIKKRKK